MDRNVRVALLALQYLLITYVTSVVIATIGGASGSVAVKFATDTLFRLWVMGTIFIFFVNLKVHKKYRTPEDGLLMQPVLLSVAAIAADFLCSYFTFAVMNELQMTALVPQNYFLISFGVSLVSPTICLLLRRLGIDSPIGF